MTQTQDIFTLMGGRVKMRRSFYNPTSDAVWLAAFAPAGAKTVLDIGIGTGGAGLCYLANNPDAKLTGIDNNPEMLIECMQNAYLNNVQPELINADINTWRPAQTFDLVITNPPYFTGTPAYHNAHHNADLGKWVKRAVARVKPQGTFCIIVDAACIGQVLTAMGTNCGRITIMPLFGGVKAHAERVLIRANICSRAPSVLYRGMSMNEPRILRDGLTIDNILSTLIQK